MTLPIDDKARKDLPLWSFMFEYFPDAWLEVVRVSVEGNKQHNPGQPLHWAREKSTDQLNTAMRHQFDYGTGVKIDSKDGCYHLAKAIWRLMAQLQLDLDLEAKEKKGTVEVALPFQYASKDLHGHPNSMAQTSGFPIFGCYCAKCIEARGLKTGI
jgi:hypothetical protein